MKKDTTEVETKVYSYEVSMIVQVIADSEEQSKEKLDRDGGFVTKREVQIKDVHTLYNGEQE